MSAGVAEAQLAARVYMSELQDLKLEINRELDRTQVGENPRRHAGMGQAWLRVELAREGLASLLEQHEMRMQR